MDADHGHIRATHDRCTRLNCWTCELFICTVCGGFEGSLTSQCPGVKVSDEHLQLVYKANLDFRRDRGWYARERENWEKPVAPEFGLLVEQAILELNRTREEEEILSHHTGGTLLVKDYQTHPQTLAVLVNLAQRTRRAKKDLRRVRRTYFGENRDRVIEIASARENEAWNALQAAKAVLNRREA